MCRISDRAVSAILKKGKIYEVGGAVRDKMLGCEITVKDRDYLVCGIPYIDLSQILIHIISNRKIFILTLLSIKIKGGVVCFFINQIYF